MKWHKIGKQWRTIMVFDSMTQASQFIVQIAEIADAMDHHPDINITHCKEVMISIYTHDSNTITTKDHELIQQISALV